MEWDGGDTCLDCLQDQINLKVPALKRVLVPIPCEKHGHPGWLAPHLAAWMEFYHVISPYHTPQTTLDHELISKICTELELSFCESFEKLSTILELAKKKHADKGI